MKRLLIQIGENQSVDQVEEFIDLHYHGNKELDNELMEALKKEVNRFFEELNK